MNTFNVKSFLDDKVTEYNRPFFIETDPIRIPKQFSRKENIEISAFLTATIAWGNRKSIIVNASKLMNLMGNNPVDFIFHASSDEFNNLYGFRHRTFNGTDCEFFIRSLKNIYKNHGGLQSVFENGYKTDESVKSSLKHFHKLFFEIPGPKRTLKHVADVSGNASAKRLNMFLRWMVRSDDRGIDFGLWKGIPSSALMLPLDVHTGNVARKLGLLHRKINDWRAVEEVTAILRTFDPADPVKYDFALFGLGAFENF